MARLRIRGQQDCRHSAANPANPQPACSSGVVTVATGRRVSVALLGAVDAVAGIAEARTDIAVFVELAGDGAGEDADVGVVVLHQDRKSTRLNSSHLCASRKPSPA